MDLKEVGDSLVHTWQEVMLSPEKFYQNLDKNISWGYVALFVCACGIAAGLIKTVLTFGAYFLSVFLYPVYMLFFTLAGGVFVYFTFKMLGGSGSFTDTIRLIAYSQANCVLSFGIPFLGLFIGMYQVLILTVGGKEIHELDNRRSLLAVLLPLLVITLLISLLGTITGISFYGSILSHEGQIQ